MKRSVDRILTTNVGSLARPDYLLDLMKARLGGEPYDDQDYQSAVGQAVRDAVRQQVECGIDVVSDGEQSKSGFYRYLDERLDGFEPGSPGTLSGAWHDEIAAFPEYYARYMNKHERARDVAPSQPLVCVGPVSYRGQAALQLDLGNLKAALAATPAVEAFVPSAAPSSLGENRYYRTEEEYRTAVADALRIEYLAIVDAGFILQVDDPWLMDYFAISSSTDPGDRRKAAEAYVEIVNYALRGIQRDKVRFHVCYGINEGPRVHDASLGDVVNVLLKVNAGAFSFEAANPRHEHEYHVWEKVKLPDGVILMPGVVFHGSNVVEHPEWIAERILRYARIVGRENVIAGADCGFSSQARYTPEVHPTVVWAKFRAMDEGARLASRQLFP